MSMARSVIGNPYSAGGGGGSAPVGAQYVVMVADATLTDERVLTAGAGILIVDGGAGGPVTISAGVGVSGWTDTGTVVALTTITDTVAIGVAAMFAAEKLRVVGDVRIEGKLTVTGALDPTSVLLSDPAAGTALFYESNDGQTAPVSGAATGRLRYNNATGLWQVSTQGGAYVNMGTATSGGGWTDDGTIVRLTTVTDRVAIGTAAIVGTEKLRVIGTSRFEAGTPAASDAGIFGSLTGVIPLAAIWQGVYLDYNGVDASANDGEFYGLDIDATAASSGAPPFVGLRVLMPVAYTNAEQGAVVQGNGFTVELATGSYAVSVTGGMLITGTIQGAVGSAALPEFTFSFDSDTGMFRSAANTLAFSAGGVQRLSVSTVNVISTLASTWPLGTAALPAYSFTGDTDTGIYSSAANTLNVALAGVEAARFTTGQFLFVDRGTAAAPAYTFTLDADTGMFSSGANNINLTTAGVLRITVDSTNLTTTLAVLHPLGTAALPSMSFTGDTNTGIFSSAPDILDLSAGGTARFQVNTGFLVMNVPLRGAAGSAAAPTYTINGDTDTGMFSTGANSINLATAGVLRITVDSTNLTTTLAVLNPLGTAALPSMSFSGDTDTGVFSSAANTLNFTTSGIEAARFTSGQILQMVFGGTAAAPAIALTGDTNTGISWTAADTLVLSTGGTARLTIDSAGKVTIPGVLDPTAVVLSGGTSLFFESSNGSTAGLSVLGSGRIRFLTGTGWQTSIDGGAYTTLATGAGAAFVQNGNSFGATATLGTADAFSLIFETNNVTRQTIASTGAFTYAIPDNTAAAFNILEGANSYFKIDTTNGGELITVGASIALGTDDVYQIGDPTTRLGGIFLSTAAQFFTASGDANASALYGSDLQMGAGGASATDLRMRRSAAKTWTVDDTAGGNITFVVTGKLTVTGSIDPTDVTLSGGTAQFMQYGAGSTAAVGAASTGRIRYNEGTNKLQVSQNGAAYVDMIGSGGVTGSGAANQVSYWSSASAITGTTGFTFDATPKRLTVEIIQLGANATPATGDVWFTTPFISYRTAGGTRTAVNAEDTQTVTGQKTFSTGPILSDATFAAQIQTQLEFSSFGNPTAAGRFSRNANLLKFHDGGAVRTVIMDTTQTLTDTWTFNGAGASVIIGDELQFTSAGANATAGGRLRRNGAFLTWFDSGVGVGQLLCTVSAQTITGVHTFNAAPVFADNIRVTFNPGATVAGLNVGAQAGDPSTLVNGDIWYDSTANQLKARVNGATVVLA